jgi:RNA-directed DNA polymerase
LSEDLLERILSPENLRTAWKQVKANNGAPGVDGVTVEEFPARVRAEWERVRRQLLKGTYHPRPVLRVEIPKSGGGKRPLGIPTVLDRLIQQAILQELTPLFDPHFSESSYGFRPGRSAHGAVRQVRNYAMEGYRTAVDLDLEKFFDRVSHDVLMVRVARRVKDKRVLKLIANYLRCGVQVEGKIQPTTEGTPQGGPISPLLANILLDDLDKELAKRGHRFARYADDVLILVRSSTTGRRVMQSITRFMEKRLKLRVNREKSGVRHLSHTKYLGFRIRGRQIWWSESSLETFKNQIRYLTNRSWGISMTERVRRLSRYVTGWLNYYGLSEYKKPIDELDGWIRRRVRMCYWKQWKNRGTRIGKLLSMGVEYHLAIGQGKCRRGPWYASNMNGLRYALSNAWLDANGLVSFQQQWVQLASIR